MKKKELPKIELVNYRNNFKDEHGYMFCERCGRSDSYRYEVHHLVYRSEKPKHKNINHKNNLILLCDECHRKLHNVKSERKNIAKYLLAKNLFQ